MTGKVLLAIAAILRVLKTCLLVFQYNRWAPQKAEKNR
jgi:hypothetical protein